jgi:hypothetical protein
MFDGRPVKILAAYLLPSRPLIGEDLAVCFDGRLPVLVAGDINAKHVDWNSRLRRRRGNSYVIRPTGTLVRSLDPTPNQISIQLLRYSRCLGYRDNQEHLISGVSDDVFCTKLGPLVSTN